MLGREQPRQTIEGQPMDTEDSAAPKRDRAHEVVRGFLVTCNNQQFTTRTERLDPYVRMRDTVGSAGRNDNLFDTHGDVRSFTGRPFVARGATS